MPQRIRSPFGTVFIDEDNHSMIDSLFGDQEHRTRRHEPVSMTPDVDVYEDDNGFSIWMDLPGVDKGSIQVAITGSVLSVNANTQKLDLKGGHWVRHERRTGDYVRNLQLGQNVDANSVKANYADGTLKLDVNKKDQTESKAIKVDIG